MAGELSPDRQYYWDGVRWASAVSADGLWRWDGQSWRAATGGSPRTGRSRAIIAAVVIAAVVVGTFGAYEVSRWVSAQAQSLLHASGVDVTCGDSHARAGASISEGEVLCGKGLGTSYFSADCAELSGTPSGGQFLDSAGGGDWQTIQVVPSGSGCPLDAQPSHEVMLSTADDQPASSTLIVDFVATGWAGGIGLQLACGREVGCVDFSFWGDSLFSLDEGQPNDGFENMTSGHMGSFGPPPVPRVGSENRIILRLAGDRVDVFLNGKEVTHATVKHPQVAGFADFYVDGRETSNGETILVKRMFLFQTVSA
jgi:hypothetical protein